MQHPIQPLYNDKVLGLRFKQNSIVRFLLDAGPFSLDQLHQMSFNDEDMIQFYQLIGYSLVGFGEMGFVSSEVYEKAASQQITDTAP